MQSFKYLARAEKKEKKQAFKDFSSASWAVWMQTCCFTVYVHASSHTSQKMLKRNLQPDILRHPCIPNPLKLQESVILVLLHPSQATHEQ